MLLVAGERGRRASSSGNCASCSEPYNKSSSFILFLILMIIVFPLTRLIVGTSVGTTASIVPLVIAAFPFIARLAEGSLREIDPNIELRPRRVWERHRLKL